MTNHAEIVQGLAYGVGGAILMLLGVDAQTLTAVLGACSIGALFAGPTTRVKAGAVFVAAVCSTAIAASIFGPVLSAIMPALTQAGAAKAVALGCGVFLHPAIQAFAALIPRILGAAVKRIDGGTQ